jgi:hypothetical protein
VRTLYDSTNANDIPVTARMVGGYVDGKWKWTLANWQRFPNAVHVPIACFPTTNDGVVGDVETGDMLPWELVDWVLRRRAAGVDPTGYVNRSNWKPTRTEFQLRGVPEPYWWLADYDNVPQLPVGTVAKQYANSTLAGGHYDCSVIADFWPGVDQPQPQPLKELQEMIILLGPDGSQYLLCGKFFVHIPSVPESIALQAAGAKIATVSQPFIDSIKAQIVGADNASAGTALSKFNGTVQGTLS